MNGDRSIGMCNPWVTEDGVRKEICLGVLHHLKLKMQHLTQENKYFRDTEYQTSSKGLVLLMLPVGLQTHIGIDPQGQHLCFTDCYAIATMQNHPSNVRKWDKTMDVFAVVDSTILRSLITI